MLNANRTKKGHSTSVHRTRSRWPASPAAKGQIGGRVLQSNNCGGKYSRRRESGAELGGELLEAFLALEMRDALHSPAAQVPVTEEGRLTLVLLRRSAACLYNCGEHGGTDDPGLPKGSKLEEGPVAGDEIIGRTRLGAGSVLKTALSMAKASPNRPEDPIKFRQRSHLPGQPPTP